jgi:hypothetical protein
MGVIHLDNCQFFSVVHFIRSFPASINRKVNLHSLANLLIAVPRVWFVFE